MGLSPRVRGNLLNDCGEPDRSRSIPACAGEPNMNPCGTSSARVYPRVCGGTSSTIAVNRIVAGLSPRVRGNQYDANGKLNFIGSIPACAGEPVLGIAPIFIKRVYPRVCGGTVTKSRYTGSVRGLSPRVRGNPMQLLSHAHIDWSIPACAGEPLSISLSVSRIGVYPRVCGGTRISMMPARPLPGLSPRVRGNHHVRDCFLAHPGSIPACAGEPHADKILILIEL